MRLSFAVCLGVSLALPASVIHAEPVRHLVLDDVQVMDIRGCLRLHVGFQFPIHYVTHTPLATAGDTVQIRVEPIQIPEGAELAAREALVPPGRSGAPLQEIVWEGTEPDGALLTVRFTQPVVVDVYNGADFRSLQIWLRNEATPEQACPSSDALDEQHP